MAEFPALPLWTDAAQLRMRLRNDGWVTPDTYISKAYAQIKNHPAVYLFMVYRNDNFDQALVAYVGMATRLKKRIEQHEIVRALRADQRYPFIWFKSVDKPNLRDVERGYIRAFNPPWNIIGKQRGVALT